MTYEEQLQLGNIFNMAIKQVIGGLNITEDHPEIINDIARSIFVMLDQADFEIRRKK
jgi:hypothetical protein